MFYLLCEVSLEMGSINPLVAPLLYMGGMIGENLEIKEYYKQL